jgi:hypothetical protein
MNRVNHHYPENYTPLFSASRHEMIAHQKGEAILLSISKLDLKSLRAEKGDRVSLKEYYAKHPFNPTMDWLKQSEEIEIPTEVFYKDSTQNCSAYPVTILAAIYKGLGHFASLRRNPG